jgi:hypothetical protein
MSASLCFLKKAMGRPLTVLLLVLAFPLFLSWVISHSYCFRLALDGPTQTFVIVSANGRLYLQHGTKDFTDWALRGGAPGGGPPSTWTLHSTWKPATNFHWCIVYYYVDPWLLRHCDLDWMTVYNSDVAAHILIGTYPPSMNIQQITVGYWLLMLLTLAVPVIRILNHWRRVKRLRAASSICLTCAYDLRASNDRCPECGTAIPTAAKTIV